MTTVAAPPVRRVIVAASIGNALEWFDILVYGFFAATISKLFFPSADETVSLVLTLGTFAVSYVVRPLGALVLGAYADRVGRKAALMMSIRLMMLGTLLIAVMPPYATIGVVAPIAILLARLIQGFSAGGEFGSATAFLVEHAPEKRGFMASWQFASQGFATLLASAFGTVLTATLSDAQLESWGWRVPFFFGLLIGPIGYYIRRYVDESAEFVSDAERAPVKETFRDQKSRMLVAVGALAVSTAISYLITYMPTFAVKELDLPASTGFASTLVTGIVLTGLTPIVGHLSDRFGRSIRPDTDHAGVRRGDPRVDVPELRVAGRLPRLRGDPRGDVRDRRAQGRVLRAAAGHDGRAVPGLQPRHRHGRELQRRGDDLRRHDTTGDRVAGRRDG
jgi:MHS family proline/betaine transporter-like MFS transporter